MSEIESRYSLVGVRAASTAPQERIIERAVEVLGADARILGVYLVGGFAVGMGDAFSDVDLHCIVDEPAAEELRDGWRALADRIAELVSVQPIPRRIGGVCITADWAHFDLVFHPRGSVDPGELEGVRVLLDPAGLFPPTPRARPSGVGEPFFPAAVVDRFLYMLGNVVAAIGRDEPVPLSNAAVLMRDLGLVPLMLAEQGLASAPPGRRPNPLNPFPFTKRLRPWLTDEQNTLLASLPAVRAEIDSGIDGYIALARAFIPRARALAQRTHSPYPERFERATVTYFERAVGASLGL